jgi:hypothetical protein
MPSPLTVNEAVAAELRAASARRQVSIPQIAVNASMPDKYVRNRLSAAVQISVDDLVTLCAALEIYPLDVLAQALDGTGRLLDETPETPATAGA